MKIEKYKTYYLFKRGTIIKLSNMNAGYVVCTLFLGLLAAWFTTLNTHGIWNTVLVVFLYVILGICPFFEKHLFRKTALSVFAFMLGVNLLLLLLCSYVSIKLEMPWLVLAYVAGLLLGGVVSIFIIRQNIAKGRYSPDNKEKNARKKTGWLISIPTCTGIVMGRVLMKLLDTNELCLLAALLACIVGPVIMGTAFSLLLIFICSLRYDA